MKVTLDKDEVTRILLRYAADHFPGVALNSVHLDCAYGSFRAVELSYEAPRTEEQEVRIAAVLAEPTTDLTALVEAMKS